MAAEFECSICMHACMSGTPACNKHHVFAPDSVTHQATCANGHPLCQECKGLLLVCPFCRGPWADTSTVFHIELQDDRAGWMSLRDSGDPVDEMEIFWAGGDLGALKAKLDAQRVAEVYTTMFQGSHEMALEKRAEITINGLELLASAWDQPRRAIILVIAPEFACPPLDLCLRVGHAANALFDETSIQFEPYTPQERELSALLFGRR